MTITLAALTTCILDNAYNLVPGSLVVDTRHATVTFEVVEPTGRFDITAGIIDGRIVDTCDGAEDHYDLAGYATFLRGEPTTPLAVCFSQWDKYRAAYGVADYLRCAAMSAIDAKHTRKDYLAHAVAVGCRLATAERCWAFVIAQTPKRK